ARSNQARILENAHAKQRLRPLIRERLEEFPSADCFFLPPCAEATGENLRRPGRTLHPGNQGEAANTPPQREVIHMIPHLSCSGPPRTGGPSALQPPTGKSPDGEGERHGHQGMFAASDRPICPLLSGFGRLPATSLSPRPVPRAGRVPLRSPFPCGASRPVA